MHPLSGLAEESEFFEAILKRVTVELNLIVTLNNNNLLIGMKIHKSNVTTMFSACEQRLAGQ